MTDPAKHKKLMDIAKSISALSKDRSTKVGALIIGEDGEPLTWGYNGMARGVDDDVDSRHERPAKYLWIEHAERNAIYSAARSGIKLNGGRIYITSLVPCPDCTRAMIQAGIKEILVEPAAFDESNPRVQAWIGDWKAVSKDMLEEAGVVVTVVNS
jgi:dCMP deaminase